MKSSSYTCVDVRLSSSLYTPYFVDSDNDGKLGMGCVGGGAAGGAFAADERRREVKEDELAWVVDSWSFSLMFECQSLGGYIGRYRVS